jgi:adenylate cyclase
MMKAWLAESLLRAGDPTAAALAIDDALHTVRQMEARFYEAELYGVKADVLAQNLRNERDERRAADVLRESEVALRQSFDVAAAQGAKSLQLRAAMRLARLATTAPASKAALNLLSDTYGWFSEGFTTRDLTDARMLLRSTR